MWLHGGSIILWIICGKVNDTMNLILFDLWHTFLDLWHQYIIVIKVVLFHCNMGILQSIIIILLKRKIQFLFLFLISCTIFLLSPPPIIWYRVLFFFFHLCHILFFFFHFCHLYITYPIRTFLTLFSKEHNKTCCSHQLRYYVLVQKYNWSLWFFRFKKI